MKYLQVTDGVSVGGVFNDNPGITIESDWVRIDNVTPEPQLGWSYDGTTWTNPDDGLVSVDLLRVRRDDRLRDSDHIVVRHRDQMGHDVHTTNELTDTEYQTWLKYRQDLRDLPSGYTPVANPTYPTKP